MTSYFTMLNVLDVVFKSLQYTVLGICIYTVTESTSKSTKPSSCAVSLPILLQHTALNCF